MDSPFGQQSETDSRLRFGARENGALDAAAAAGGAGRGPMFYSADATGTLLTASDELRRLIDGDSDARSAGGDMRSAGPLAAPHGDALARLRAGDGPIACTCSAVVGGVARRFAAWHACVAGSAGEAVFVGLYTEADPAGPVAANDETFSAAPLGALAEIPAPAKEALLGHVSHELRTPLNAIIGFAELSLLQVHGRLDGRYLSYISDIRSAAAQLLHVVDNLLEAADEDGGEPRRATARPLSEIVAGAKAAVAALAAARGIDLAGVTVAGDCVVRCDGQRLQRILKQLLSNAVKFSTPPGFIGVDVTHPDSDTIAITVWDKGAGIPPECRAHLFEHFGTLSADVAARPCDGLSLGLANARRLARQLGGDIRVDSDPGRGARVTVLLPAARAKSLLE